MTPFELLIVVRVQVKDRALLRHYFALQAAMEALAPAAGLDRGLASLAGLGAGIDARLCRDNPDRRGEVAAELLLAEGAPEPVAEAARQLYREPDPARLTPLAACLVGADALVGAALELLEDLSLDDLDPPLLARRVVRAAELRAQPRAKRALSAIDALPLDIDRAAALVVDGLIAARADLEP